MFTVYKIQFENKDIYIGQTKDIDKREKQHRYSIKSKPNRLYQFARDNGLKGFKLIPIRTFKTRVEGKRFECMLVLIDLFNDKELLNKVPNISDR